MGNQSNRSKFEQKSFSRRQNYQSFFDYVNTFENFIKLRGPKARRDGGTDGGKEARTDGGTDGWMDGGTDGWTDGQMDGWTQGRTDGVNFSLFYRTSSPIGAAAN